MAGWQLFKSLIFFNLRKKKTNNGSVWLLYNLYCSCVLLVLESYCILKSYLLPYFPQDNIPYDKVGCIREKYTYSLEVYVLMLYRKQCLWHLLSTCALWCFHVKLSSRQILIYFMEFTTQLFPISSTDTRFIINVGLNNSLR